VELQRGDGREVLAAGRPSMRLPGRAGGVHPPRIDVSARVGQVVTPHSARTAERPVPG
jgi:hypothetical protein